MIGTLLGIPIADLKIIEASYPNDPRRCCNTMLEKWLEIDPDASWSKLDKAIQSPAVSSIKNGNYDFCTCESIKLVKIRTVIYGLGIITLSYSLLHRGKYPTH